MSEFKSFERMKFQLALDKLRKDIKRPSEISSRDSCLNFIIEKGGFYNNTNAQLNDQGTNFVRYSNSSKIGLEQVHVNDEKKQYGQKAYEEQVSDQQNQKLSSKN